MTCGSGHESATLRRVMTTTMTSTTTTAMTTTCEGALAGRGAKRALWEHSQRLDTATASSRFGVAKLSCLEVRPAAYCASRLYRVLTASSVAGDDGGHSSRTAAVSTGYQWGAFFSDLWHMKLSFVEPEPKEGTGGRVPLVEWTEIRRGEASVWPAARSLFASTAASRPINNVGDRSVAMLVFGGLVVAEADVAATPGPRRTRNSGELWSLELRESAGALSPEWALLWSYDRESARLGPSPRHGASITHTKGTVVLFGGSELKCQSGTPQVRRLQLRVMPYRQHLTLVPLSSRRFAAVPRAVA